MKPQPIHLSNPLLPETPETGRVGVRGEYNLLVAIIIRAIFDVLELSIKGTEVLRTRREYKRTAIEWMKSDIVESSEVYFSFAFCCEHLEIDHTELRAKVFKGRHLADDDRREYFFSLISAMTHYRKLRDRDAPRIVRKKD